MALATKEKVLEIQDLEVSFIQSGEWKPVVEHISFELFKGQTLAIVGESGSGKSVTSFSLLGLLPEKIGKISAGKIIFHREALPLGNEDEMRKIRGRQIAMIFQEPMTSLNPVMRCGVQVVEALRVHESISKKEAKERVIRLFQDVKLPRPEAIFDSYPHEISGGQKQRVVIAMALICQPDIIIADEPTTALDVTVQKEILLLLKSLQLKHNLALIFISHDLDVVKNIADKIIVMKNGVVVESGNAAEVFIHPKHPYTQGLIHCKPPLNRRPLRLTTVSKFLEDNYTGKEIEEGKEERSSRQSNMYRQTPILEVRNLCKTYTSQSGWLNSKKEEVKAVDDVSFNLYAGETLGLVGESGCGKTTLSRCLLNLIPSTSGRIIYNGEDLQDLKESQMRSYRKDFQIIFQDPYSSLNPKMSIGDAILEPMEVHRIHNSKKERKEKVLELLEKTGLLPEHYDRYPHEFSGGQRQRIVIARTLALSPKIIICDESVSALDVSVQAQVLNLLNDLKADYNFTYLFISHDLSVVKYMSDRIMVMKEGKIEEIQEADELFLHPKSKYTQSLINSMY